MLALLRSHPLFRTLGEIKGNPRATVLTEPLFGIPWNLFGPFQSVYMLALGVTDQQIGSLASLGLVVQVFSALLSGALVDKFGRRRTLFITDLIAWGVPCVIWAVARDVRYFAAAAVLNALFRIAHTAWTCLMVEDAEERHLVHIWTWVTIFGVSSSFFTPLGGWFVARFGLVPAMRGLALFAGAMITLKAAVLYRYSRETARGRQRMAETRGRSLLSLLREYRGVFRQLLRSAPLLTALLLMTITNILSTISGGFWALLFVSRLGFAESEISLYVMLRSIVVTVCFFLIGPRLTNLQRVRLPLWMGFASFFASQALLVLMPARAIALLVLSVALEGVASALVSPMMEALLAVALESHERARLSAMVYVVVILFASPFGWIAGQLSAMDRTLPFVLNMGLLVIGGVLVWRAMPSGEGL